MKYLNEFMLSGHLSGNVTNSGSCLFGSLYHRIDGKAVTIAKFKGFKNVVKQIASIKPHTLIAIKGVFAPVNGYTDKKGVFHHPEMILVVSDVKVLEQPKTKEQLVKEAAQKDAALAAQATEMAPSEPEVMEYINPMELIPPVGFEEHQAVNAEMQTAAVAPQPQKVAKTTETKKGLPGLKSFNEIPSGIFNKSMASTAVKAEEETTVSDQPVEYKKECPLPNNWVLF